MFLTRACWACYRGTLKRILRVSLTGVLLNAAWLALHPSKAYGQNVAEDISWEPSIALDLADATHPLIIVGNGFELEAANAGATFSFLAATQDLPGGASCGDGVVTFDSRGHLYWIRLACLNAIQSAAVTPGDAGTAYKVGDTLTVQGGNNGTVQVTSVDANGGVTGITIEQGGSGYSKGVFPTQGGTGTGCEISVSAISGWQAAVEQVDAVTGQEVGQTYYFPSPSPWYDDKPWIAADANAASPYADNVYAVWSRDVYSASTDWFQLYFSKYDPNAQAWSTPVALTASNTCAVWPATVTVAGGADVYVTYQVCNPAQLQVLRSTDGGASFMNGAGFQEPMTVIPAGQDNLNGNDPNSPPGIPHDSDHVFAPTGAFLVPDDTRPGQVHVVANTTPSTDPTSSVVVSSTGTCPQAAGPCSWSLPTQIGNAPAGTIQIMPIAASDGKGNLILDWYDNRDGLTDAAGNYEFSVYSTISRDGGVSWEPAFELSKYPIAVADNNDRHLGEYAALASQQGVVYTAWMDPNNAGISSCAPGCFDAFLTARPAKSLSVTASGGGCGNAWVTASVSGGLWWHESVDQIEFSAPPDYTVAPISSFANYPAPGVFPPTVTQEAFTEVTNPNLPRPVSVWVRATDVSQSAPQNSGGAVVSFSGTAGCQTAAVPRCVRGLCGPYKVPGVLDATTVTGPLEDTSVGAKIGCSTAECDRPGFLVDYNASRGEDVGIADLRLKTMTRSEAARLSAHLRVRILGKSAAVALLTSSRYVVSSQAEGPTTTFIGPVFEISSDRLVSPNSLMFDVAFTYPKGLPPGARFEVVRLVKTRVGGRWWSADNTITKVTRTALSAWVRGPGAYTVIAQRFANELEGPYSHGQKEQVEGRTSSGAAQAQRGGGTRSWGEPHRGEPRQR